MKILNANVNCFGGQYEHREEYKTIWKYSYLKEWDKLDKTANADGISGCIDSEKPDVVIFEEYDINSPEAKGFTGQMKEWGYILASVDIEARQRPSMTVFFIRDTLRYEVIPTGHERNARAFAIKINDLIIYGTHVPPKYDKQYWDEIRAFMNKYKEEKIMLIGDFNTINFRNQDEMDDIVNKEIIKIREKISEIGDHVLVSGKLHPDDISSIEVKKTKFTDHPIFVVS